MKLLLIGILLLIYAMFFTPAYFEPADLVISTAYITTFTAMGFPLWVLFLWIISGYVALGIAIFLHIHFIVFKVKHPFVIGGIIAVFTILLGYYLIVVNDLLVAG